MKKMQNHRNTKKFNVKTSLASFSAKSTKYKSTKSTTRAKIAQNFDLKSKLFF